MKTRTKAKCIFLAMLMSTAISIAHADEEEEEGRETEDIVKNMFFGDWQDAMKTGKLELVGIVEYEYLKEGGDAEHERGVDLEVEYFPFENFEVELELEAIKNVEADGDGEGSETDIGEIELALEYRLLHLFAPNVDLRLGFEFAQPLSHPDDGITDGFRKYEPYISGRSLLGPVHVFGKVGWEFKERDSGDEEDEGDELEWHLAAMYPWEKTRFGAELFGETNELDGGDELELYVAPEFRFRIWDDVEAGIAAPIGLTDDSADWGVFFHMYIGFDLREGKASEDEHIVFRR